MKDKSAVILFAHGSRDPQWRMPFEAILQRVKQSNPGLAGLAFLENMQPSLSESIADMVRAGALEIKIVPLFLAVGSHVRKDLPDLLAQARELHPEVKITASEAIGENQTIQHAIAQFALAQST